MSAVRASGKPPLVVYVALLLSGVPLGVVQTHGMDAEAALLMASMRWRFSRYQITVKPWDDCTRLQQQRAAAAEAEHWQQRHRQLATATG